MGELYKELFKRVGEVKSVLDIGCGMHPLSFPSKDVKYYAYDIAEDDIAFLQKYFTTLNIKGKAVVGDVTEDKVLESLPKVDVAFLLKVLDPLERKKGHKFSEQLLDKVRAKWLVVSFATTTVSGKQMRHSYRGWIERLLERKGWLFYQLLFENEVFYLINKHKKG